MDCHLLQRVWSSCSMSVGSTACTLSQWQIMSTRAAAARTRWRCAGPEIPSSNRGCFQIWETAQWCLSQSGQADLTKSPGRDLPFGAARSAHQIFFYNNGSISMVAEMLWRFPFRSCGACIAPKEDSWRCGSPHGGRTETWLSVSGG